MPWHCSRKSSKLESCWLRSMTGRSTRVRTPNRFKSCSCRYCRLEPATKNPRTKKTEYERHGRKSEVKPGPKNSRVWVRDGCVHRPKPDHFISKSYRIVWTWCAPSMNRVWLELATTSSAKI